MEEVTRYTLALLVDNSSGVLAQVSNLFSRKGFNIETVAVGVTEDPEISRMTFEVKTDRARVNLLCNQLRKMIPVHSVKILLEAQSIRRELLLIKVLTPNGNIRSDVMQIANIFRASIIDVSGTTLTISVIGDETKTDAVIGVLSEYGILEIARTGITAVERGTHTINEDTKEKGEFNYGKNVL